MIAANELRIGNWVKWRMDETDDFKIETADASIIYAVEKKNIKEGNIYPIPLTPEILEKAGFENKNSVGLRMDIRWDETPFYSAYLWLEFSAGNMYLYTADDGHDVILASHVLYLHQLQNLNFALTGKELPISL